jgi:lipoate-protein ligase A
MSMDMALLDRAEYSAEAWLRLYRWEPGCLSFGRNEPATRRYDTARIKAMALDTVRRPSGGRAVWHDRELTYAVAAPCAAFGSLQSAYRAIHSLLLIALNRLGLSATLAPRTRVPSLGTGACFSQPVGGEVLVNGRKVVGSAQLQRGNAFLQHGSILLQDEQSKVREVMSGNSATDSSEEPAPDPLSQVSPAALIDTILDSARSWSDGRQYRVTDPERVFQLAARHQPLFRSDAWTWAR